MYFNAWDAERIAAWKDQIAQRIATKEGLRAEIYHHFVRQGHQDPDAILTRWGDIELQRDSQGQWLAWLPLRGQAAVL